MNKSVTKTYADAMVDIVHRYLVDRPNEMRRGDSGHAGATV